MGRMEMAALAVAVALAAPALAGAEDSQRCAAAKLQAAGRYARCRLLAESRNARADDPARRDDRIARCTEKLESAFAKAEQRYGAACPTTGDASTVDHVTGSSLEDVSAYLIGDAPALDVTACAEGTRLDPATETCRAELLVTASATPPPGYSWTHGRADYWATLDVELDVEFDSYATAAAAVGSKIFLFGTAIYSSGAGPTDAVTVIDVNHQTVSGGAAMPAARFGHAAAALGDRIHVVGGQSQSGLTARHDVYDPATDTWSSRAPLPSARAMLALVNVGGRLFALGGQTVPGTPLLADLDEYDPHADSWLPRARVPNRHEVRRAVTYRDRIYMTGWTSIDVYHPDIDYWWSTSAVPWGPSAEFGDAAAATDERIYLFGGYQVGCFPNLDVFDPQSHSWDRRRAPSSRIGGLAVPIDDRIYVLGGACSSSQPAIEVLMPEGYVHRLD